jgi:hypothetical protein
VADGIGHRQDGEAERQCDAGKADTELRKGGGENGAAAAAENEPERAEELGSQPLRHSVHR